MPVLEHLAQFGYIWVNLGMYVLGKTELEAQGSAAAPKVVHCIAPSPPSTLYIILLLFISSIGRSLRYHSLLQIAAGHSRLGGMTPPPLLRQPDHDPRE